MAEPGGPYDLIIVGSGVGGLVAALAARTWGLRPLVLEKTDKLGGNSAMSGGVFWSPANPALERDGVPDSLEAGMRYLDHAIKTSGAGSTVERRTAFLRETPEMLKFLESQDIRFQRQPGRSDYYDDLPGGSAEGRSIEVGLFNVNTLGAWKDKMRLSFRRMPVIGREMPTLMLMRRTPAGFLMAARLGFRMVMDKLLGRVRVGFGAAMMARILEKCIAQGVEIRVSAPVRKLIVEGGKVVGVIAEEGGRDVEFRSSHGVLIAAGGFARNPAMREKYLPHPTKVEWTMCNPGETGDMIAEAEALGAAVDQMDQAIGIPSAMMPGVGPYPVFSELQKPFGILVDKEGKRFCNEAASYMEVAQKLYERDRAVPAIPSWLIMDARFRRFYTFGAEPPGAVPRKWIENGFMRVSDTLAGLAADCGIDSKGLVETVTRFNTFARDGVDRDFARGARHYDRFFGDPNVKPNSSLGPIEQGPFLAVAVYPGDVGTYGGLVADQYARVLRKDGKIFEGLFATGTSTAPVTGGVYPGAGASISASATFGYIAARYCAGILQNYETIAHDNAA